MQRSWRALTVLLLYQPCSSSAVQSLAAAPLPGGVLCTAMQSGSCWHNAHPASHVAKIDLHAANETAAACSCYAKCSVTPKCAHWHVMSTGGAGEFECDLRTADVSRGTGRCITDANPSPTPTPVPTPPDPEGRYPQPPLPPPGPPPQPVLGYKPHLIFHLVDDVGHYNFGWRGNEEARTPHIDSLVDQGLILDRHYVFK